MTTIILNKEDLDIALILAQKRSKIDVWKGGWGKGILNCDSFKIKTELVGVLSEIAVSKYLQSSIDEEKRKNGDDGKDIIVNVNFKNKKTIAIGCKDILYPLKNKNIPFFKKESYFGYSIAEKESGKKVKTKIDLEVFTNTETIRKIDSIQSFLCLKDIKVNILGFLNKNQITCFKKERLFKSLNNKSNHMNYYFLIKELYSEKILKSFLEKVKI
jgi:hypothetical protein